jgi:hypothetical protein
MSVLVSESVPLHGDHDPWLISHRHLLKKKNSSDRPPTLTIYSGNPIDQETHIFILTTAEEFFKDYMSDRGKIIKNTYCNAQWVNLKGIHIETRLKSRWSVPLTT